MAREEGIELIYVNTKAHEWLTLKDEAVLLPMGMKEHIDHIVLREAVLDARNELKQEANATVYLGEDQPYTGLADTNDWDILIDKPKENRSVEEKYRNEMFQLELELGEAISTIVSWITLDNR